MAADGPKSGYLGNLNKDQEVKLQTLWEVLLKASESTLSNEPSNGGTEQPATPTQTQRRHSILSLPRATSQEIVPLRTKLTSSISWYISKN